MPNEPLMNPQAQFPFLPLILIFFIFYFLVFKPQKDKQKERDKMLGNLKKNDEVVTSSGIHGTIVQIKEKTLILRVDDNVKIEFDKDAVTTVAKTSS